MALAIDAGVLEQQERKTKPSRHRIKYSRRFWNIETQSYDFEVTETEVLKSDVRAVGASREALDRKGVNKFESSNITINLHNPGNIWSPLNPDGLFAADSIARLGYERQLMKFSIDLIYELEDGTDATPIPVFTDGRAIKFINRPDSDVIQITIESKSILLKLADAENISDTISNAGLVGTVDGSNTTFTSPDFGVGRIDEVREGGIPRTLGSQVKISDLKDPDIGATFEFTVAPVVQPFADYIIWKQDFSIEDLVALLVVEGGIPLIDTEITPVTFPTQVLNKKVFTSQADWEAGTISQSPSGINEIETDIVPGDMGLERMRVFDDFNDGSFSDGNPRTWTPLAGDPAWSVSGGIVNKSGFSGNSLSTPSTQTQGTFEVRMALNGNSGTVTYFPIQSNANNLSGNGYELLVRVSVVGTSVRFIRRDAGGFVTIFSGGGNSDGSFHIYRMTRTSAGLWTLYKDGTSIGSFTDNTYTVSAFMGFVGSSSTVKQMDDVRTSLLVIPGSDETGATGIHTTAGFDTGPGNPASYGLLDHIDTIPSGGSLLYETATSDDGITFDPFVPIGGTNLILSTARRFIKVRTTFTPNLNKSVTPIVSEIVINFITTSTTIRLANFTRLTVFNAIGILGQIANFEWGISRAGKFFFRPRTFKTTADHTVILADVTAFSRIEDGIDRVFNLIRAAYGDHEKLASPTLRGDPSPNSFDRFGVRTLEVGSTQLLLDPDADIATGLALAYFQEFKNPRRIFELDIDLRPQIELTDAINLKILDSVPDPSWHIGDTSRGIGDTDISLYGAAQQSAFGILARVLSVRHNVITMKTSLELEEII